MMKQVLRCMPYALILSVVVFFMACSKDGAQGPAGPAGNNGAQGPQGPKGTDGEPGSANVIYSGWLDVRFQGAQTVTNPDGTVDTVVYAATLPAPKLDSAVLSNALVNVYINLGTPSQQSIVLLPYTDEYGTLIRYVAASKSISLIANGNPSTQTTSTGKRYQYRYVIVPGGVNARSASLDWKNYYQVQQVLQIKD
ncbi:collagen-like triple helix repeat-containing protein [Chitinophaga qingshengii]|uniref:Collagen-like protein n=1 Tax=Chitinophaga qingshengii TaxID=1569794 RepID=A0ABR7TSQ1_9BACT|nr:collagen-like protein [Chitinophaga qingshengii]MBC9932623.1 collagen-like protein [Chitinophaga qingshengii]